MLTKNFILQTIEYSNRISCLTFLFCSFYKQNLQGFHWMDPNAHCLTSDISGVDGSKQKTNKRKPFIFTNCFHGIAKKNLYSKKKKKKGKKNYKCPFTCSMSISIDWIECLAPEENIFIHNLLSSVFVFIFISMFVHNIRKRYSNILIIIVDIKIESAIVDGGPIA